jgi:putative transposase
VIDRFNDERLRCKEQAPCAAYLSLKNRELQLTIQVMTWIPKQLTRKQIEERRLAGGKLLKEGRLSKAQIAHKLGVSRAAVTYWARRKRFGGLRRLQSRKSSGRPPKLTPQQQRTLLRYLKRGALRADFPTDRWTLRRIQHMIKKEFDRAYHPNYLSRFLRNLGWTPQLPVPRAAERDDRLVEAWLRRDWPRIKKSAAHRCRYRVF